MLKDEITMKMAFRDSINGKYRYIVYCVRGEAEVIAIKSL